MVYTKDSENKLMLVAWKSPSRQLCTWYTRGMILVKRNIFRVVDYLAGVSWKKVMLPIIEEEDAGSAMHAYFVQTIVKENLSRGSGERIWCYEDLTGTDLSTAVHWSTRAFLGHL